MPQEQNILLCYSCSTFQVHIVKKDKKFVCKMCGEKQSIKRIYGQGSGKECREQVQKLNQIKHEQSVEVENDYIAGNYEPPSVDFEECGIGRSDVCSFSSSKWTQFIDNSNPTETEESNVEDDIKYLCIPNEKKRKSSSTLFCNKRRAVPVVGDNSTRRIKEIDVEPQKFLPSGNLQPELEKPSVTTCNNNFQSMSKYNKYLTLEHSEVQQTKEMTQSMKYNNNWGDEHNDLEHVLNF